MSRRIVNAESPTLSPVDADGRNAHGNGDGDGVGETLASRVESLLRELPAEGLTLRALLDKLGQEGLLFFSMLLTLPFLLPVSVPGVSTAFGLLLTLVGVGVALNRLPWLPDRLMRKHLSRESLLGTLTRASKLFARLDRLSRPRLTVMTHGGSLNRLNGAALAFSGFLLVLPLAPIPFTNTLPAFAALLFSVGILQRDGAAILGGYLAVLGTLTYFGLLALAAVTAGHGLEQLLSPGGAGTEPG